MFRYVHQFGKKLYSRIGSYLRRNRALAKNGLCKTWNVLISVASTFRCMMFYLRNKRSKSRLPGWLVIFVAAYFIFVLVIEHWPYIKGRISLLSTNEIVEITIAASLVLITSMYTLYTKRLSDLQRASIFHLHEISTLQFCPYVIVTSHKVTARDDELILSASIKNIGPADALNVSSEIYGYSEHIELKEKVLKSGTGKERLVPDDEIEISTKCPLEFAQKLYETEASAVGLVSFCTFTIKYVDAIGNQYSHILDITLYFPSRTPDRWPIGRLDRYRFRKSPPSSRSSFYRTIYKIPVVDIDDKSIMYFEYQYFKFRKSWEKYKCSNIAR